MKANRGASLVELLVVMSACCVILTMSAGLIHRAMRSQSHSRIHFDVERTALRLSGQFRHDVHRATAATSGSGSPSDSALLQLRLPDGNFVEYRRWDDGVLRLLLQDGRTMAREEFRFSPGIDVLLQDDDSTRRFVLSIANKPAETSAGSGKPSARLDEASIGFRVEAVLSRDRRSAPMAAGPGGLK